MNKLNIESYQRFGIEIEFINLDTVKAQREMRICELAYRGWLIEPEQEIDGDTMDGSGEAISPILKNDSQSISDIYLACKTLISAYARESFGCGAHIHFDAEKINIDNVRHIQDLILLLICYEDVVYKFSAGTDERTRYGYLIHANTIHNTIPLEFVTKYFYENIERSEFEDIVIKKLNKKCGINLCNLTTSKEVNKNTIEFRMPNGTLNPEVWLNNINTFGLMLERAYNMPKYMRDYLYRRIVSEYNNCDIYKTDLEKAVEFITLIRKDNDDIERFMNQYRKDDYMWYNVKESEVKL